MWQKVTPQTRTDAIIPLKSEENKVKIGFGNNRINDKLRFLLPI